MDTISKFFIKKKKKNEKKRRNTTHTNLAFWLFIEIVTFASRHIRPNATAGHSIEFPGLSPCKEEWSFHPSCSQNRISWSPFAGLTTHRTAGSFERSSTSATAVHVPPSFDMRKSYQSGLLHRLKPLWWIQPSAQVFQDQNISWRNPPQVGSKFSGIRNPVGWARVKSEVRPSRW